MNASVKINNEVKPLRPNSQTHVGNLDVLFYAAVADLETKTTGTKKPA